MAKHEKIISLTKNLNVVQRMNAKKQLAIVKNLKNPEIDKFLTQMELIIDNANEYIKQTVIKTDESIAEVFAEMEEMKKETKS